MNHVLNISLIIIGIVTMCVMPPLGLLMIVAAGFSHKANRGKQKRYEAVVRAKHAQKVSRHAQKVRRARILAFKSL